VLGFFGSLFLLNFILGECFFKEEAKLMIKETAICWSEEDRGDWDNAEQGRHGEIWCLPILTFRRNYSPKTFCSFNVVFFFYSGIIHIQSVHPNLSSWLIASSSVGYVVCRRTIIPPKCPRALHHCPLS
jgi:hypothetical protein